MNASIIDAVHTPIGRYGGSLSTVRTDDLAALPIAVLKERNAHVDEIIPVTIPQRKGDDIIFDTDEHPRPGVIAEKLGGLKGVNGPDLSVTAGNASGVHDVRGCGPRSRHDT